MLNIDDMTFEEAIDVVRAFATKLVIDGPQYRAVLEVMAYKWDQETVDRINRLYPWPDMIPEETLMILYFQFAEPHFRAISRKSIETARASDWTKQE